jgi:mRNA-degrading endonuclease RelE of RelBE toxin-antitoxin system
MYKAELYKEAVKYYKKLDIKIQRRVKTAIDSIIMDPSKGKHIKQLKGRLTGKYR